MAVIVMLVIIFAVVAGVAAGLTVVSSLGSIGTRSNAKVKELQQALRESRATETVAVKALRRIADPTCGAPVLEASNALDTINNLEIKEIS